MEDINHMVLMIEDMVVRCVRLLLVPQERLEENSRRFVCLAPSTGKQSAWEVGMNPRKHVSKSEANQCEWRPRPQPPASRTVRREGGRVCRARH